MPARPTEELPSGDGVPADRLRAAPAARGNVRVVAPSLGSRRLVNPARMPDAVAADPPPEHRRPRRTPVPCSARLRSSSPRAIPRVVQISSAASSPPRSVYRRRSAWQGRRWCGSRLACPTAKAAWNFASSVVFQASMILIVFRARAVKLAMEAPGSHRFGQRIQLLILGIGDRRAFLVDRWDDLIRTAWCWREGGGQCLEIFPSEDSSRSKM